MEPKKTIRIECSGSHSYALSELVPFQGNLKDLSKKNYEKLKKLILDLGYSSPIHVWENKKKYWCLDGHQRIRTLQTMEKEGYKIPKLPVTMVKAKNIKEAKQKVLALTSQFGQMTGSGLYEFLHDSDLEDLELEENFRFPEIDFAKFNKEFYEEEVTAPEDSGTPPEQPEKKFRLEVTCPTAVILREIFEELQDRGLECKITD